MSASQADLDAMTAARAACSAAIMASAAPKRVIVAGPGTGKTHTFKEVLTPLAGERLALTFLTLLVRDLEPELSGLASVYSFHGFAHKRLREHAVDGVSGHVRYYPGVSALMVDDIRIRDGTFIQQLDLGSLFRNITVDEHLLQLALASGNYYDAVGHDDSVYRVLRAMERDPSLVPGYELIVVDEFQDFCPLEVRFIDVLSSKSKVLIVGDDDQALYAFRDSTPQDIRRLASDDAYERFELPYCSRCTQVIVEATHSVVAKAQDAGLLAGRVEKQYMCFLPGKLAESQANPKITHATCSVQRVNAPYMGRYVAAIIRAITPEDVAESKAGGYPTVLIIGPNPFRQQVEDHLTPLFPGVVRRTESPLSPSLLEAYDMLRLDPRSRLAWRILLYLLEPAGWENIVKRALQDGDELVDLCDGAFVAQHQQIAGLLQRVRHGDELAEEEVRTLAQALGVTQVDLPAFISPEAEVRLELDDDQPTIMITSLMSSKGLQASHVFVVGVNDGHFPVSNSAPSDEEVCQLLVALTRTRKSCTIVSTRRLGQQPLQQSVFTRWLYLHLQSVYVDREALDALETNAVRPVSG